MQVTLLKPLCPRDKVMYWCRRVSLLTCRVCRAAVVGILNEFQLEMEYLLVEGNLSFAKVSLLQLHSQERETAWPLLSTYCTSEKTG